MNQRKGNGRPDREERLAQQLRANLRRRKAQARAIHEHENPDGKSDSEQD